MKEQIKKGFSLLELVLVLGVGTIMGYLKLQDMKNNQEDIMAQAVGSQMKQIGEAVNRYISIRYDRLSTLSNAAGTGTDPGPRTCSASLCEITYQTLINEGLLPSTHAGINAQKSSYKIILKRDGTAPNYVINGLIATTTVWKEGTKIRYDLLGKAMWAAGIDSGVTRTATTASGYQGQWSEKSSDYSNITAEGLLAYRVGYDSSMYSVYLRRDGTLPMTGNLNMGGQSINNTKDINASGITTSGELRSTGATTVGSTLNVRGVATLSSNLNVSGNTQVNGTINSNNTVSGATVTSRGETYTQNWFRTLGDGGIYFQKYGGGWNMTNTSTITAYAGKNVQTTGGFYGAYIKSTGNIDATGNITSSSQVKGATVVSSGRTTVGEFLQMNRVATAGAGCSPNGLQGRDAAGSILSCVSGIWVKSGANLSSSCKWIQASNAYDNIAGYKNAACPAGYVMTGLRWFQVPSYIDDEHVDSYCCPLN